MTPCKPIGDIRETESHAAALLQMLKNQENLSEQLILKWHENIFKRTKSDIAGRFRNYPVRVGFILRQIGKT
jgi:hypothetical protein